MGEMFSSLLPLSEVGHVKRSWTRGSDPHGKSIGANLGSASRFPRIARLPAAAPKMSERRTDARPAACHADDSLPDIGPFRLAGIDEAATLSSGVRSRPTYSDASIPGGVVTELQHP